MFTKFLEEDSKLDFVSYCVQVSEIKIEKLHCHTSSLFVILHLHLLWTLSHANLVFLLNVGVLFSYDV